jgi:predicted GNAT family acetyltransferase
METEETAAHPVIRHDDRGRYELEVDGDVVAFAQFSESDRLVTIPYIETDVHHRGKGYSSLLMDGVIEDLRNREVQVRATCSVARAHIAQHAAELLVPTTGPS